MYLGIKTCTFFVNHFSIFSCGDFVIALVIVLCVFLWIYHEIRYKNRPVMSGPGLYDPTSIMNADTLAKCQREGWIKLAVYLLSFFYYLYG